MDEFDFESALVTKIITEKDIRTVIKQKIDSSFFFSAMPKAAFLYLMDWYRNPEYGDTPSWELFESYFDGFEPVETQDSVVALCNQVRQRRLYSDIAEALGHVGEVTRGSALEGLEELKRQVSRLAIRHTVNNTSSIQQHLEEIKANYMLLKSMDSDKKLRGLPYPWPELNRATLGAARGNLIVLYGRPKSMKTWLALDTVRMWNDVGARICVFSQEMSSQEMARRFVALVTKVDYRRFTRGELEPQEERDFFENLELFHERPPFDIDTIVSRGTDVEIELKSKIEEHNYTGVLIDGAHKMGRDWKEIADVLTATKRVIKDNIPALVTTHAHRRGGKTEVGGDADDVAHSDAFFQDCDLGLRVLREKEHKAKKVICVWTSAVREGDSCAFEVSSRTGELFLTQTRAIPIEEDEDEEAGETNEEEADVGGDDDDEDRGRGVGAVQQQPAKKSLKERMNGASA